ncbi:YeeE/YedE thiosulfate transporter family protein [Falsiroseomonas selenitidurans]|uniref:YeeE/YedE family protein n=1 Tax=Falsiroseomonas selenitidurans TaxID=2716335 RepID=A0ABX1E7S1_9PROT|nr:YeeE/YedE thiosulfate transporter family protein [Falsiroseomonas selenitidurans]NKC33234.1 YeeE/YedE family protein [Falsiroseomonas selenitidurans]
MMLAPAPPHAGRPTPDLPTQPPVRPHVLGLALGFAGITLVLAGVLLLPDPALGPVFLVALLLGAAFVLFDFGFAGGFRALQLEGDGRAMAASFLIPAIAALVILPLGSLAEGYGRFVAPIGAPLLLGALLFGIGMQIANGCGSGVLVAAGQGSRRMWVALPCFCLGGVLGSLALPMGLALPDLGHADLVAWLGPWGALPATLALLGLGAALLLRGRRPERRQIRAAAVVGLLAGLLFLASGLPWGITTGLTLWAAQVMQALGLDMAGLPFWSEGWARAALAGPLLANHTSLSDFGLLLGALVAAAASGQLRHAVKLGARGTAGAVLGGLLLGFGARLSFGCNIGAFIGGTASGSLHGFVWLLAVLPGSWIGIRLRPFFGLPRR